MKDIKSNGIEALKQLRAYCLAEFGVEDFKLTKTFVTGLAEKAHIQSRKDRVREHLASMDYMTIRLYEEVLKEDYADDK